ncbi:trafficking protein particle complex 6b-like-related [Anaeramoeba flamelloides]|uniref:Trafficking protein particle complex 6b-like-related n=1 Tax=Anaeramoeba flamelloides TaxID=1746091 RepID=A0ABQ8Z4F6_9EUKA|nr:trafficking protein particle complex 6b-like-related [Anaeramoeba flamelloides]
MGENFFETLDSFCEVLLGKSLLQFVDLKDSDLNRESIQLADVVPDFNDKEQLKDFLGKIGDNIGIAWFSTLNVTPPEIKSQMELVKYVATTFWTRLTRHKVSSMKTNHKGTWNLSDKNFKLNPEPLTTNKNTTTTEIENSQLYLPVIVGILKEILKILSIPATSITHHSTSNNLILNIRF